MTKDIKSFVNCFLRNILAMMLPIVLVGIIIVGVLLRNLINDTQMLNNTLVEQWNNLVKSDLQEITYLSHQIELREGNISNYAKKINTGVKPDVFESYDVVKELQHYNTKNILCEEIAIYFKAGEVIISDNAVYELEEYYQINFAKTGISFESWKNSLKKSGREGFFLSKGNEDDKLLLYCRNLKFNNNSEQMFLARIKAETFSERVNQISAKKNIAFAMSDNQGNIIIKSSDFITPYKDTKVLKRNSSLKNVICLYQFDDYDYSEIYIPIAVLVSLFLLAVMLSVVLGNREMRRLKNAVGSVFDEIDCLENDIDEKFEIMKGKTLLNIMCNQPVNENELHMIENEFMSTETEQCYNVVVAEFKEIDEINIPINEIERAIKKIIDEVREYIDKLNIKCNIIRYNTQRYVCVLCYERDYINQKALKSLLTEIFKECKFTILAGIGKESSELKNINVSYDTAKTAKYYAQNDVSKNIISWDDIKSFETDKVYYSVDKESSVIKAVSSGDIDSLKKVFDELFDVNFCERKLSHSMSHRLISKIVMTVYDLLDKLCVSETEKYEKFERICRNTEKNENPQESFDVLKKICLELCCDRGKQFGRDVLIKRIEKYIGDNYMNSNLNLTMVAEQLDINYHHLSRIFSENFGCNFATYLATVRLEKVKELLVGTDDSVEQIAKTVGFLSSGALIRVFQKFYGTTPGKYRKNN